MRIHPGELPPRRPSLYELREEFLAPALVRAVRSGRPETLRQLCREVHPQVYVFDMLHPEFCTGLLEEAAWFESWCEQVGLPPIRPNTMNNYGTVLDTFGFAPLLQQLMTEYVHPFSALFYPDVGGGSLDGHHGFIVEYKIGKDTSLDFHVDASDVTLNVCLGKEFTGGTLFFRGIRCALCQETAPKPEEEFEIAHLPGQAILHRGKHRHGAQPDQRRRASTSSCGVTAPSSSATVTRALPCLVRRAWTEGVGSRTGRSCTCCPSWACRRAALGIQFNRFLHEIPEVTNPIGHIYLRGGKIHAGASMRELIPQPGVDGLQDTGLLLRMLRLGHCRLLADDEGIHVGLAVIVQHEYHVGEVHERLDRAGRQDR